MPQQTGGCVGVAGVDQQMPALIRQRQPDDQRRGRAAVQAADLVPGNYFGSDLQVLLVNLDGGPQSEVQHQERARDRKRHGGPSPWPPPRERDPNRHQRQPQRGHASPNVTGRRSVSGDGLGHNLRLTPRAAAVNSPTLATAVSLSIRSEFRSKRWLPTWPTRPPEKG